MNEETKKAIQEIVAAIAAAVAAGDTETEQEATALLNEVLASVEPLEEEPVEEVAASEDTEDTEDSDESGEEVEKNESGDSNDDDESEGESSDEQGEEKKNKEAGDDADDSAESRMETENDNMSQVNEDPRVEALRKTQKKGKKVSLTVKKTLSQLKKKYSVDPLQKAVDSLQNSQVDIVKTVTEAIKQIDAKYKAELAELNDRVLLTEVVCSRLVDADELKKQLEVIKKKDSEKKGSEPKKIDKNKALEVLADMVEKAQGGKASDAAKGMRKLKRSVPDALEGFRKNTALQKAFGLT